MSADPASSRALATSTDFTCSRGAVASDGCERPARGGTKARQVHRQFLRVLQGDNEELRRRIEELSLKSAELDVEQQVDLT